MEYLTGRGFDSPHLHQKVSNIMSKSEVVRLENAELGIAHKGFGVVHIYWPCTKHRERELLVTMSLGMLREFISRCDASSLQEEIYDPNLAVKNKREFNKISLKKE
tara:strand:- start:14 stop:331 length:318 start_codon:yes stop_codon:yes gene_type:complete